MLRTKLKYSEMMRNEELGNSVPPSSYDAVLFIRLAIIRSIPILMTAALKSCTEVQPNHLSPS